MCGFVLLRGLRLDQQQRVVELDVGIAELESLEILATLPVGSAEEVAAGRAFDDGLLQHRAVFQTRQVEVAERVFPKRHRADGGLVGLPVKFLQLVPQMNRRPGGDHQLVVDAHSLDLRSQTRRAGIERKTSTVGFADVGLSCAGQSSHL